MADTDFKSRCVAVLKERWAEPFFGIVIGASSALIVLLLIPLAKPLLNLAASTVPKTLTCAAAWPPAGNGLLAIALVTIAVLLARPMWDWSARLLRSWRVGLVSGMSVVFAIASFLTLLNPTGSRFSHPWTYAASGVVYGLVTVLISARNRVDISRSDVMRRLNLPRDQIQRMRSTVLAGDVFASVVENPNPITEWEQDWIGRAAFVEGVLQRVILDEEPVVAITGDFGSGKSSALHLTKEALRPCPNVFPVMFSSYLPGDEHTLVASLLSSITSAIREGYIVPGLSQDFARYGRTIAGAIPKVGKSLRQFLEQPSQDEEIKKLRDILCRLPIRVVVLLDEIDRLQRDEFMIVLKLLRGVADLPRLRYVCAFNKGAIARLAPGSNWNDGNEYLEKFFPVELAMPKVDEEALQALFFTRLAAIREKYGTGAGSDEKSVAEGWDRLWSTAGKGHFTTLRRLSTYFKNLDAASQAISAEVNFFDLSVLEAVRQISPWVFEFIYSNGRLFYFPSWRLSLWAERITVDETAEREEINNALDRFFSSLDPGIREVSIQLLSKIFPNVDSYNQGGGFTLGGPARDSAEAERLKRIYHPDYFHRYFTYQVPASLYGEQEMARFMGRVSKAVGREGITKALGDEVAVLNKMPLRRRDFFDRLVEGSRKLKPNQAECLAYSVAEMSSSLTSDILGLGEQDRARALVFAVANRYIGGHKAHEVLETVIRIASSDGFAADVLFFSIHQDRNNIILQWENIDAGQLQAVFAERMKAKYSPSTDQRIPSDRSALAAFFTWSKISESAQNDVVAYIRNQFEKSGEEIASFIAWTFPGDVNYDKNPGAVVSRLFPVAELQALTAGLENQVELTDVQREALERFRKLCPPPGQEMEPRSE